VLRPTDSPRALASALLLAALPARAGEVRLEAVPARVALCADQVAEVRVESAPPPLLSASAGVLSAPRPAGPGRWVADWRPPEECHPQVAIVSAQAGGAWAWLTLPLVGQGDALVRTSPRAVISVRIGEREFGPATADDAGRALVPVEVPPGVRSAWHGRREIPLGLPPLRRVHLALGALALPADQGGEVAVRAFAVADDGSPGDASQVVLTATEGALGPARAVEPGVVEASWRLVPGRAGTAAVTAVLPRDRGGEARAALLRPAGPAATAAVSALPAVLVAGQGDEVRVAVRLEDAQGNPAAGPARLSASFGEVVAFAPGAPGEWVGLVRVPAELGAHRKLELAVRAGGAAGRATVRLRPGPPEQLEVQVAERTLLADGRGEAQVLLRASDRFGNLADEPPTLTAELGRIGAPAPDGAGAWRASYRAPRLEQPSWDGLSARLGGARGGERLRLLARPRALSVSPKLGLSLRAGGLSPAASLEVAWWPAALRGRIGLAAEAGWWAFSRTDRVDLGGQPLALRGRADLAPVALTALARMGLGERGSAWVGLGGGAVLLRARVAQGVLAGAAETGVAPEAHAQVGAGWRLGPGIPVLEARAAWQGDAGVSSMTGSLLTFTLSLGYRLETL
jgi:hypothetical protein